MAVLGDQLTSLLSNYWGYKSFTPAQTQIIESVMAGNDTIGLIPTGGGKSVCYQIPAIYNDGVVIVISPLIALMQDQVSGLCAKGIPAVTIHSALSSTKITDIYTSIAAGEYKLLYVSPERLHTRAFLDLLVETSISLIAVDEAHCISQWGHDFRPSYLLINSIRAKLPAVPVLALTATATPRIVEDMITYLALDKPEIVRQALSRNNLHLTVFKTYNKDKEIISLIQNKHIDQTGIIYVRSRKETLRIAELIKEYTTADAYHAGQNMQTRKAKQTNWITGNTKCIVATNAFGMGIDKANVRYVIHYGVPPSLEEYTQEIGRAGRDKQPSDCYLFYNDKDIFSAQKLLESKYPSIQELVQVYVELNEYLDKHSDPINEQSYTFSFDHFCRSSSISRVVIFSALNQLVKEECIEIIELDAVLSLVWIKTQSYTELEKLDDFSQELIKAIVSTCVGSRYKMTAVNELELASIVKANEKAIVNQLQLLHNQGVIQYERKKSSTVIHILEKEVAHEKLEPTYQLRMNNDKERMLTMQEYVKSSSCLQQYLSQYFNGESEEPCGTCLCCRINETSDYTTDRDIQQKIMQLLDDKGILLDTLISKFDFSERAMVKMQLGALEMDGSIYIKDKVIFSS